MSVTALNLNQKLKNLQSRFFSGNVSAQQGRFVTSGDVDELRKKALKTYKLNGKLQKKYNEFKKR